MALQPGDIVITPKLDRMFRSALDALEVLGELKDRSVSLHMIDLGGDVTGNGISKLVFTILSAVAEAERDRIRERIAEVKRDQETRGRFRRLGAIRLPGRRRQRLGAGARAAEGDRPHEAHEGQGRVPACDIAAAMQARGITISHQGVKKTLARATAPASQVRNTA